jgi:hypothetical protein
VSAAFPRKVVCVDISVHGSFALLFDLGREYEAVGEEDCFLYVMNDYGVVDPYLKSRFVENDGSVTVYDEEERI